MPFHWHVLTPEQVKLQKKFSLYQFKRQRCSPTEHSMSESVDEQLFLAAMKSLKIDFCIGFEHLGRYSVANKAVFQMIF